MSKWDNWFECEECEQIIFGETPMFGQVCHLCAMKPINKILKEFEKDFKRRIKEREDD